MSNKRFEQFTYSLEKKLRLIYGSWVLGAGGAVASYSGNGLLSVIKLATGVYQIQLNDNYYFYKGSQFSIESPPSGADVADGAFVVNTLYQIKTVGTTNWHAVGVPSGIVPAVGVSFVATAVGGAGTGIARAIDAAGSGIRIEVVGDPNTETQWADAITGSSGGSIMLVQTFKGAVLGDGLQGSKIRFVLSFRDSMLSV